MSMMNLTRLDKEHYQIRFAYKDRLTGKQKIIKRRFHGTLEEAKIERDRLKAQVKSGSGDAPQIQRQTLRHYRDSFVNARKSRRGWKAAQATRERDFYALTGHILPAMGDWLVSEITLADLERVVDYWLGLEQPEGKGRSPGEPYSIATVNQWIKATRLYLSWCAKMEGIDSPADDLDYLAREKKQVGTALTGEQTAMLLDHMRTRFQQWYPMCVLGFGTGLRFSSLSALRWQDVDKGKGVIVFYESQYRGARSKGDKMGKVIRIPLIPAFERALDSHRRWLMEKQHPGLVTGLVFPSKKIDGVQNGHVSKSALARALRVTCEEVEKAMRKEAGNPGLKFPRITPHDMRRTFITNSYAKQLDPHAIQGAAGHSQEKMSYHYDHVSLDRMADVLSQAAEGLGL